eukprot:6491313-Amphidinium_carterae.1
MTTWDGLTLMPTFGNDSLGWVATDANFWGRQLGMGCHWYEFCKMNDNWDGVSIGLCLQWKVAIVL